MENFDELIAGKSKEELESLFNDDEKIRNMVIESNSVKNLKANKKRLMKSNQQIAKKNLESEPILEKLREDLIAAHCDFSETLRDYTTYKSKLGRYYFVLMLILL